MNTKYDELWAKHILKRSSIRTTEARLLMLQIMAEAKRPLEAREIHEVLLRQSGTGEIWLSTVYRNLELFSEKGLVQSVNPPENEAVFYQLELGEHNHYAFCERCGRGIPLDLCPIEELEGQLEARGFKPTHHRLEIYGLCRECREKEKK